MIFIPKIILNFLFLSCLNTYRNTCINNSNLYNLITELNDGLGARSGKLKEIDKFDSSFFGIITLAADAMDPHGRILLETAYECMCDAGVNPRTFRGTNTGVYIGINTVGECTISLY